MGMEVGDSDHCASPPPMPEEGGGGGEATIAMMITMMPIVLRTPVQEGGGRRCCLPWQSRRNVSILSLVDTADNNDGKLVVKQPKGKENNADYHPRHIKTDNGGNTRSAILISARRCWRLSASDLHHAAVHCTFVCRRRDHPCHRGKQVAGPQFAAVPSRRRPILKPRL